MGIHTIKKGLDLPITGSPKQVIENSPETSKVAIVATEFVGMKARMAVEVGDEVKRGQLLFEDRKNPGGLFTAPGAGKVTAINRGAKRALLSLVIELNDAEKSGNLGDNDHVNFESYTGKAADELSGEEVRALLIESGEWTAIRQRPYSRVAPVDGNVPAIFVTAADTHPLAPDVDVAIDANKEAFETGLRALKKLTDGEVYLCAMENSTVTSTDCKVEVFSGPHPAGTAGMHIHTLRPVNRSIAVWHVGYQDVIAIGHLLSTGKIFADRVVSLAGPAVSQPRLVQTRRGASTLDLTDGQLKQGENRVIAGSVLGGRTAGCDVQGYMGRFVNQISVLAEGREREFLGWLAPGENRFSVSAAFMSKLFPMKRFAFTTNLMGSHRAIVPIGMYEKVMPLDIMPTFLLRSLAVSDLERAEQLGCLELDEEDLALCTFVCPGKNDYGPMLRSVLTTIEKEG